MMYKSAGCKTQSGTTLIGILVGLVISIGGILVSLNLYKNLIDVSVESRSDAIHDGQIATAILAAQLELQEAGYGIDDQNSANPNITFEETSDGTKQIQSFLWRYVDEANPNPNPNQAQCKRLSSVYDTDSDENRLELYGPQDCALDVTLESLDIDNTPNLIARIRAQVSVTAEGAFLPEQINRLFEFSLASDTVCTPFGIGQPTNHALATIRTIGSSVAAQTDYNFCLASINNAQTAP